MTPSLSTPMPAYVGEAEADDLPLRTFIVTIGTKDSSRLMFEVQAQTTSQAQAEHKHRAELGERVEAWPVMTLEELRDGGAL